MASVITDRVTSGRSDYAVQLVRYKGATLLLVKS
jgi:hypothetical protein